MKKSIWYTNLCISFITALLYLMFVGDKPEIALIIYFGIATLLNQSSIMEHIK
jgi:hypothetical protein